MSRIHEALRQAAEEQDASASSAAASETPTPVEGDSINALAREPFPVELAPQQRRRRQPAVESEPVTPSIDPESATADEEAPPRRDSLFERIDTSLAE
jgi:hypothetical protein